MSLKPTPIQPVPEETIRIARAAFRKGNPLLKLRDELGAIFADADFTDLFPKLGQPGLPPWRLARITSPSCRSARTCPTGGRPRRCTPASTGSTDSGWS